MFLEWVYLTKSAREVLQEIV